MSEAISGPIERASATESQEEACGAIGIATAARWLLLQHPDRHDDLAGRVATRHIGVDKQH
jgi:hypothetical protein